MPSLLFLWPEKKIETGSKRAAVVRCIATAADSRGSFDHSFFARVLCARQIVKAELPLAFPLLLTDLPMMLGRTEIARALVESRSTPRGKARGFSTCHFF